MARLAKSHEFLIVHVTSKRHFSEIDCLIGTIVAEKAIPMVLGACVVVGPGGMTSIKPESISIIGEQDGFIVGFTVVQAFVHGGSTSADVRYIIPTNSKMCVYDTVFRVGSETIRAVLQEKAMAEEIFISAQSEGRAALIGQNLGDGLVQFKLGNIAGNTRCEVEVKVGFSCVGTGAIQFFKFPLDVCTPSGSVQCVTELLTGAFTFSLRHVNNASVSNISSNVNGGYDADQGIYIVSEKPSVSSIIVTTHLKTAVASDVIHCANSLAVTVVPPNFGDGHKNNEFIFVVDCSGSMSGQRIRRARECLKLFIRSLPPHSFFNVVRFGSTMRLAFWYLIALHGSDSEVGSCSG